MYRHTRASLAITALALLLISTSGSRPVLGAETVESPGADLMLIVDASNSMWGQIDGENKIVIARRVLGDVLGKIPDGVSVGLVAYGHRREGDCNDIEIVVPPAPIDRAVLKKKIDSLNPKGKTPITASLLRVFDDLAKRNRPATVVLVSDGIETCNADPCQAVRDAKAKGIKFIMHVIGFDVGDFDASQLECAAQAGGGLYFSADDAGQFTAALGQAVAQTPESPTGQLSVRATNGGTLIDVLLEVRPSGSDEIVTSSRTYESADSNPRIMPLAEGSYDLKATAVAIDGNPEKTLTGIVIENGKTVEKAVDFVSGKLRVKALRDGKLTDAAVVVRAADNKEQIAGGRTYESDKTNPLEFELPAGKYNVDAKAVGIKDSSIMEWKDVAVAAGELVERTADFSSGKLRVKVTRNGALSDATVYVFRQAKRQQVAGNRTYNDPKKNPAEIELAAGTYDVEVGSVEIAGKPSRRWEGVIIGGEQLVELEHEFASGTLRVGAKRGGELVDATIQIKDAGNASVGGGRTYADAKSNPKVFTLSPGNYAITVTPVKNDASSKRELSVTIEAGSTLEEIVELAR